jgi:hypothetical protein
MTSDRLELTYERLDIEDGRARDGVEPPHQQVETVHVD